MANNNSNKNSRVSKNDNLYITKQQQFNFSEYEDNLDDTFLLEYKNLKRKNNKKDKQKEINKALSKELKKELKERKIKNKKTLNYKKIMNIFLLISIGLICFIVFHYKTFNHHKVKTITKEVTVVEDNYLFLGDSITHRYDLEKYFKNMPVVNSGIDGNKTTDILENMKKRVYDYNPSKVFLMIGINDLSRKNELEVEEIFDNIQKIVEEIEKNRPQANIYLESVLPVNHDIEDTTSITRDYNRIIDLNKKIKSYANKNKITYINLYDKLVDDEDRLKEEYTKDGLHLSDKGYEELTKILKNYVK